MQGSWNSNRTRSLVLILWTRKRSSGSAYACCRFVHAFSCCNTQHQPCVGLAFGHLPVIHWGHYIVLELVKHLAVCSWWQDCRRRTLRGANSSSALSLLHPRVLLKALAAPLAWQGSQFGFRKNSCLQTLIIALAQRAEWFPDCLYLLAKSLLHRALW